jgi:hypothetical protein
LDVLEVSNAEDKVSADSKRNDAQGGDVQDKHVSVAPFLLQVQVIVRVVKDGIQGEQVHYGTQQACPAQHI